MPKPRAKYAYVLTITLLRVAPRVWRKVVVPSSITLTKLHVVLQTAMGWGDYHLHMFETPEGPFGIPDPDFPDDTISQARVPLSRFLAEKNDRIRYLYDFGDGWEHEIRLDRVMGPWPGEVPIECVDGERACPPEDVGGPYGYAEFLNAIGDPTHPEHAVMLQWVGGEFDPEAFDGEAVNRMLPYALKRRR
jgi:hypothetical protein